LPRYEDLEFRRYLRRYHRAMLTKGRARATELFDREAAETWTKRRSADGASSHPNDLGA
jgi:predicted metal-binding protein